MDDHIDAEGRVDLTGFLEDRYPDAHALEAQPEWIEDLQDAHKAIEAAFVRKRGSVPFPRVELNVRNQISDETGWHQIEFSGKWIYPYSNPPAGIVAALVCLEENVDTDAFERWWYEQV